MMRIMGWSGVLFILPILGLAKTKDFQERLVPVPEDQPVPVEDFFRPWLLTRPSLNPAGTHFAGLISSRDDRTDLISFELSTKKTDRLSAGDGFDVYDYRWLNDKRLIFQVSQAKYYATGLFAVELEKLGDAYALIRHSVLVPVGYPRAQPLQMIVWIKNSADLRGADGGVIKIDTRRVVNANDRLSLNVRVGGDDGSRFDVIKTYPSPPAGEPVRYIVDREGELAFAVTVRDGIASLYRYGTEGWALCPVNLDEIFIAGPGDAQDQLLVYVTNQKGQPMALHPMDARTGVVGELLFRDEKYDVEDGDFYRDPMNGRVLGLRYDRKGPQSVWFDPSYAAIQKLLESVLPKQSVHILGSDRNQKQFFFSASSDVHPPVYYHFDLETQKVTPVTDVAPWIDSKRMRPMRSITYTARDGREIEGYVTLPAGASKEKPAPMVVLVHGGPWVRDSWGWDGEVQFLASRGYAVFQPNYRGSTGYLWRFPKEDEWDFRKMHQDVTDGVQAVLKTGLIDPDRLAIMGSSFGGYLALSGVAHEPDLYRCAITIAGVFDWERVIKDSKDNEYRRGGYGTLLRKLGNPSANEARFEEISPIHHVKRVKVPVFVAHGAMDVVAAVAQSKKLIGELKKHGVPYEKQIERDEGHGFRQLDNQVELYSGIEAFLGRHLASKPAIAAVGAGAAAP